MLDVHGVNTGTEFVTSSDAKVYGFDRIRRPHDIGFISHSNVSTLGKRIQKKKRVLGGGGGGD